MQAMEICREFYQDYLAKMIHEKFPEYEARIALGLVGEGSECFGYDDEFSKDHDFGYGLCLWLRDQDYDLIGEDLSDSYHQALGQFEKNLSDRSLGDTIKTIDLASGRARYDRRRGVLKISDFYKSLLGLEIDINKPALTEGQWFYLDEWRLAQATNGQVFRDDLGVFSNIRNMLLEYYPKRVWLMRLANALHGFAGGVQANYPRSMARGDEVTAFICKNQGLERAIELVFLLSKTFAPYYKWAFKAMGDLPKNKSFTNPGFKDWIIEISNLLKELSRLGSQAGAWDQYPYRSDSVNTGDQVVRLFEEVARLLVSELNRQGLTESRNPFLEVHSQILAREVSK